MAAGNVNIATVIAITSIHFYLQFDLTNKTGLGLGFRAGELGLMQWLYNTIQPVVVSLALLF